MTILFMVMYIIVIMIRPSEWIWGLANVRILDSLAMLLIPACLLSAKKNELGREWWMPETKMAVLFILGASLSCIFYGLDMMIAAFATLTKTILLYFMIILVGSKPRGFRAIIWTILFCVAWMAIHGILQITRGIGFGPQLPLFRNDTGVYQIVGYGTFSDPNDICLVFIMAIPLLINEFRHNANIFLKWISLAMIPLVLCATWLTNSRGGIVGFFGMIAAYVLIGGKGKKRILVILAILFLILSFAPPRFTKNLAIDSERVGLWGEGILALKSSPIFGVGWNRFDEITGGAMAHNSYINAAAELGLIGYIPWFSIIFLTLLHAIRAISSVDTISGDDKGQLIAQFSALAGYLTAIYFLSRSYNDVLFILLALMLAKTEIVSQKYNLNAKIFGLRIKDVRKGVVFAVTSIVFLWVMTRAGNALR